MAIGLPQLPAIPTLLDYTAARDNLFEILSKISRRAVQDDLTIAPGNDMVVSGTSVDGTPVVDSHSPVTLQSPVTVDLAPMPAVGQPQDSTTLNDWLRHIWSTGLVDGGAITHNGAAGTVSVAANDFVTRQGTLEDDPLVVYRDPGVTSLALTANEVSYVYREYNLGEISWLATTSVANFNGIDKVVNCAVGRNGTRMNYITAENMNVDFQRKERRKDVEFSGYVYNGFWQSVLGTSTVSASGLKLLVGAGKYFWFANEHSHAAFDTTVAGAADANNFIYFYNRTPPWTQVTGQKSINATQYDLAGTLTTMTNNRWRTDWVYVVLDDGFAPYLAVVMGDAQYLSEDAAARAPQPPVPHQFDGIAVLVAQITIQKSASTFTVSQAGLATFTPAAPVAFVSDDNTLNADVYPMWVTGTGATEEFISTAYFRWHPSTQTFSLLGPVLAGDDALNNYPVDSPVFYYATALSSVVANFTASAAGGNGAQITLRSTGSAGVGLMTTGDWIGLIGFRGVDDQFGVVPTYAGTSSAAIRADATENWSTTAHGTKLVFATTPNLSVTKSDVVTIGQAGTGVVLDVNANAAAPPTPQANTIFHISGPDATSSLFLIDTFGQGPNFQFRRAQGTNASKSAIDAANLSLGAFAGAGYGATGYGTARTQIVFRSAEAWSDTVQGALMQFYCTPIGGVVTAEKMRLDDAGVLKIGPSGAQPITLAGATGIATATGFAVTGGVAGQVVAADGAGAVWPTLGTLRTLKETVFAGITPVGYTTGTTTTIDGCGYTCTLVGNSAADMVATGLRVRQGTTGGTGHGSEMRITAGNTGDFLSLVGEARYRRGRFAVWMRRASYDFTNAGTVGYGVMDVQHAANWGVSLRCKNLNGCPATATGGNAVNSYWAAADVAATSYPGVSTSDVLMAYVRDPEHIDFYSGVYSAGWPTMESMTFMGAMNLQTTQWLIGTNTQLAAALIDIVFYVGGSNATSGTYEIIFDRWRITTWE